MAVLVVVLAPALLQYNERSRAERDNSAMDEVVNAVQLALADAQIYDEVVRFSTVDNISCYVDTDSEANYKRIVTKSNPDGVDQYTFDSTARQKDETPFYAAGNMRGVTLTFAPDKGSNGSTFDFKQGVVNQYVQIKGNHRVGALQGLYGRIDSSVGESLEIKSQTYRNSEYTIFIRLGSTGGNDESKQNSIQTYGQWSGTNLPAEVSYKLVIDRTIGDPGNQIVEIDDSKWNEKNGSKITVNPGDLNGGGSFTPGTETGNKEGYTAEDFAEDEKGIYVYLVDGNTLVLRNSPRQDMSNVTKDYGIMPNNMFYETSRPYHNERGSIVYVDIETPILPNSCANWFSNMNQLVEIKNGKNLCMDQCTSIYRMFLGCKNLKEIDSTYWNTSNVTTFEYAFIYCSNLETLDVSNWDTGKVKTMYSTFDGCHKLKELDFSNFDTSNVTNMRGMFYECSSITKLDISNFNTSNVTTMQGMFQYCNNLTELDISGFDTSKVTNMSHMFSFCRSLTSLDLSNFNTSNVTNMSAMFAYLNISALDLSNFDTSNVTNMNSMFVYSGRITLDLSNFDTSKATDMGGMFSYSGVTTLDISGKLCKRADGTEYLSWDTSNVDNMKNMFYGSGYVSTEITIKGDISSYSGMFGASATQAGSLITVNYTAETSELVDAMIATKSANGNVVKGRLVE